MTVWSCGVESNMPALMWGTFANVPPVTPRFADEEGFP
jgi:hypothetical protein